MNKQSLGDYIGAVRGGVGAFDIIQNDDDTATLLVLELHAPYRFLDVIVPYAGLMATSDATIYGHAGLRFEFDMTEKWQFAPSFAVGHYGEGDGKDLGHNLEFKSALEVSYALDDNSRIGTSFSHISNASLGDSNPGSEYITIHYTYLLK